MRRLLYFFFLFPSFIMWFVLGGVAMAMMLRGETVFANSRKLFWFFARVEQTPLHQKKHYMHRWEYHRWDFIFWSYFGFFVFIFKNASESINFWEAQERGGGGALAPPPPFLYFLSNDGFRSLFEKMTKKLFSQKIKSLLATLPQATCLGIIGIIWYHIIIYFIESIILSSFLSCRLIPINVFHTPWQTFPDRPDFFCRFNFLFLCVKITENPSFFEKPP